MKRYALPALALLLAGLVGLTLWFAGARTTRAAGSRGDVSALGPNSSSELEGLEDGVKSPGVFELPGKDGRTSLASDVESAPEGADGPELPEEGPRVARGRVVDSAQDGIPDATVVLQEELDWGVVIPPEAELIEEMHDWFTRREATTDADGWYAFEEPPSGNYEIVARSATHAPGRMEGLTIPKEESVEFASLELERGAVLQGTVVGPGGQGIAGALLLRSLGADVESGWAKLPGRGIPLGECAADGSFVIANVDEGDFTLLVDAEGFLPSEQRVSAVPAGRTPRNYRVHLLQGLEIRGRVLDFPPEKASVLQVVARSAPRKEERAAQEENGPVLTAVAHRPRSSSVAPDGSFVLTGMEAGRRYRLTVYEPNRNAKPVPGVVPRPSRAREPDAVYAYGGDKDVELKLHVPSQLRFRVVDAVSKKPLTNFLTAAGFGGTSWLKREGTIVREHADGRVEFEDLRRQDEESKPKLVIRATGYEEFEKKDFDLEPGGEADLGDIEVTPCGVVVCRVLDEETGEPIEKAGIYLAGEDGEGWVNWYVRSRKKDDLYANQRVSFARTDAEGIGKVSRKPGTPLKIRATAEGYQASEAESVIVPAVGELEVTIELQRGATALVRVVDSLGEPVEGVSILLRRMGSHADDNADEWASVPEDQKTDAEGAYRFLDLEEGDYAFRTTTEEDWVYLEPQADMERPPWVDAHLVAGEETEVTLVGPARSIVFGTIREAGVPLDRAVLRLEPVVAEGDDVDDGTIYGSSEVDGTYRLEGVPVGEYRFFVSHGSRLMADVFDLRIGVEPEEFDVDLGVASIEGRVLDENGEPLAGVRIYVGDEEGEAGAFADAGEVVVTADEEGDPNWSEIESEEVSNFTDVTGRYELRGVLPDAVLIVRARSDLATREQQRVDPLGRDEVLRDVDFSLTRAGRCTVRVAGPPDDQRRLRVRLTLLDGDKKGATKSSSISRWRHRRTLSSLLPGRWKVEIFERKRRSREDGPLLAEGEVEIRAEELSEITLPIP